jgi:ligand-binding sensor domain-containing protein
LVQIDSLGIHHIPQEEHLSEVKIKTITSDNSGNIWAGTEGKGILFKEIKQIDSIVVDTTNGKELDSDPIITTDTIAITVSINHIIDTDKGLLSDWIRSIQVVDNTIWVASYSAGISKFIYDSKKKRIASSKKFTRKNGIEDLQIRDMKKDSLGKIWYATQNGHLGYIEKNKVTHLGNVLNQKTAIRTLLFHKNILYLGTAGRGIWWSNFDGNIAFKKLKGRKRPYSDNIYQIIFDDKNNLWAGSERGVDRIELNQSNDIVDVFHFGRNDGFLGIETCLNAVTKDNQGNHKWTVLL